MSSNTINPTRSAQSFDQRTDSIRATGASGVVENLTPGSQSSAPPQRLCTSSCLTIALQVTGVALIVILTTITIILSLITGSAIYAALAVATFFSAISSIACIFLAHKINDCFQHIFSRY